MSIIFQTQSIPLSRPSYPVGVFRYDGEGNYFFLPNIRCLSIQYRIGADPGRARFRYVFAGNADEAFPRHVEQVIGLDTGGPLVLQQDDRIVVRAYYGEDAWEVLFDGFVQIPQADLSPETEMATFSALGTPIRLWDWPLGGALMRQADKPDKSNNDVQTGLRAEFNPDGHPNASPDQRDSGQGNQQYPVFLGPVWPPTQTDPEDSSKKLCQINGETLRMWTLGMAARYVTLVGQRNPDGSIDETFVKIGDVSGWDNGLCTFVPANEGSEIDYSDPESYKRNPIEVVDYDVTGEAWPVALQRLIEPHGFNLRFVLETNNNGDPVWRLQLFDVTYNWSVKPMLLQEPGEPLNPAQSWTNAVSVARDSSGLVNDFILDSAPVRYEIGVVLVPLFEIAAADADDPTKFVGTEASLYRDFGFDECGEGHWDFDASSWKTGQPGDLTPVLDPKEDEEDAPEGAPRPKKFVKRRRPARARLVSVDDEQKPLHAKLYVSADYEGDAPALWDGTGTWQEIDTGNWALLTDRLGIRVTAHDPNSWAIGTPAENDIVAYEGSPNKINLIEWLAKPSQDFPRPKLLLVCTIEGDMGLDIRAAKRAASPTQYSVQRRIDARQRFKKGVITRYSYLSNEHGPDGEDETPYDDTDDAQAQCDGMRRAHELPAFAGSVTIPEITTAYQVGDKIPGIFGRDISFSTSAASEQGETPIFPQIVGVNFEFDGVQKTVLELADHRAEPPPKHRESRDD